MVAYFYMPTGNNRLLNKDVVYMFNNNITAQSFSVLCQVSIQVSKQCQDLAPFSVDCKCLQTAFVDVKKSIRIWK